MTSTTPGTTAPENGNADAHDKKSDRYFLAIAPIWRALVHLCLPMIAAVSVGAIYNIISAGFIGSLHSTPLLAAITFGLPVIPLMMAIGGVFGVGGSTMVSRIMGAADQAAKSEAASRSESAPRAGASAVTDPDLIKRVVGFTIWGAILAGIVIGGVCLVFLDPIVHVLGADAAAFAPTAQYVGVILAFFPVLTAAFALEQLVRAEGASKASMIGLIASTIGNLVFDVLFILVLHWGVLGAGLAIGLSNLIAVGYYLWFLRTKSANGISLSPKWFSVRLAIVKEVFGVGVSELLMSSFMIVTALLLNNLAVQYGDAVLAAFGVALRIVQLPEFLVMGITLGVLSLFAYSFGAGNKKRLSSAIRTSAITIGGITVVFSGLVFVFRDQVFGLFSSDADVLRDGVLILTAQLVATIFNGVTGLLIAVFQGTGKMRAATIMSVAQGVLFIPIVLLANLWFGLAGIIWAMTVTELLTLMVALVLYRIERPTRAVPTAEEAAAAASLVGAEGLVGA
jgi:MATE family, multidrug efflux pump